MKRRGGKRRKPEVEKEKEEERQERGEIGDGMEREEEKGREMTERRNIDGERLEGAGETEICHK